MISDQKEEHIDNIVAPALALEAEEQALVQETLQYLEIEHPEDAQLAIRRFQDLDLLGKAISRFPSVMESQIIRGVERNGKTLVASLTQFSKSSRILHTPSRVVASRSYLVAKSHAFSLLCILIDRTHPLQSRLKDVIFKVACALMAEDVYLACLENPVFPIEKKTRLASDLVHLWEHGIDPRSVQHVPSLQALWSARESSPPTFGTLDGSSELIRLSMDLDDDWQEFLLHNLHNEETKAALEEFLFGLSYEEIQQLRSRLAKYGICAIDYADVHAYLGTEPAYGDYAGFIHKGDPRAIYDFYAERRDSAQYRQRAKVPGPHKTLEELYLIYRMFQD
jgi:hypothetical protein